MVGDGREVGEVGLQSTPVKGFIHDNSVFLCVGNEVPRLLLVLLD